jgi:hypothetical protein
MSWHTVSYGNWFTQRRSSGRNSNKNVNFTLGTNSTHELRTSVFALLVTGPGNHTVYREVVEEIIRGFLIRGTLEPSRFGLRFPQRDPRMDIRVVVV